MTGYETQLLKVSQGRIFMIDKFNGYRTKHARLLFQYEILLHGSQNDTYLDIR